MGLIFVTVVTDFVTEVHPHMRGANHIRPAAGAEVLWFIPTCVGLIKNLNVMPLVAKVHPHMRGANSSGFSVLMAVVGSSPHAWG